MPKESAPKREQAEAEQAISADGKSLEEITLIELNFTPAILNELYDALEQSRLIINKYYGVSSRFPTEERDRISALAIESDLLILEFNELYVMSGSLLEKLKKKYFLDQGIEITPEEKEVFGQKLELVKVRVNSLLDETESFVKMLRDQHKFQPLPIR